MVFLTEREMAAVKSSVPGRELFEAEQRQAATAHHRRTSNEMG